MECIKFNPADLEGMIKLMEEYGDSETAKFGNNEFGENVSISIFNDKIVTVTYQNNGWVRKNIYYSDGCSEEFLNGKYE